MRGVYDAEDQRTESPSRIRRRNLMVERRARDRATFVDAEPYRLLIYSVAVHLKLEPSKLLRYPSLGLRPGLLAGIANGNVKRISRETADSLRELIRLLPSEQETA
jgi:hypothetical protein